MEIGIIQEHLPCSIQGEALVLDDYFVGYAIGLHEASECGDVSDVDRIHLASYRLHFVDIVCEHHGYVSGTGDQDLPGEIRQWVRIVLVRLDRSTNDLSRTMGIRL